MNYPGQYPPPGPRGPMDDIRGGVATTVAAMAALLLGSQFNTYTVSYVTAIAEQSYSDEIVDLIAVAWMILAYPLVFYMARASIIAAMTAIGVHLAYRFI